MTVDFRSFWSPLRFEGGPETLTLRSLVRRMESTMEEARNGTTWEPLNDRDYDIMINNWVHEETPNSSDGNVVLGVSLARKWSQNDLGTFDLPVPTPEQKEQAQAYLAHLGLEDVPLKTYLILGAM